MTDMEPLVIAFDTTAAIAEAAADSILNDPRPEIQNAEKIISVIAATAVKMGAVLLSYDNHFDNLNWPGLAVKK
jgi:hypothetical protein